jgi:transposase
MSTPQHTIGFRDAVVTATDEGLSTTDAERLFQVPRRTINRWRQRKRTTGSSAPGTHSGRPALLAAWDQPLRAWVADDASITLAALCERVAAAGGVAVSQATMCRRLQHLGLRRKKRP